MMMMTRGRDRKKEKKDDEMQEKNVGNDVGTMHGFP